VGHGRTSRDLWHGGLLRFARSSACALVLLLTIPARAPAQLLEEDGRSTGDAETSRAGGFFATAGFFVQFFGAGAGVAMGKDLSSQFALQIDGYMGTSFLPTRDHAGVAVGARYRPGGTHVIRAAVQLRRLSLELDKDSSQLLERGLIDARQQTDVGIEVAIGRELRVGTWTLGVDWLGVYVPIVALHAERQTVDPDNGEILARERRDVVRFPDIRFFYVHAGVSL